MNKSILISTGGSGGHVVPATILYDHLSKEFNVIISTDKRGLKYLDLAKYQIEIVDTPKLDKIFFFPINLIKILFLIFKSYFLLKNKVPEAHTDYIISVISEEFGVIAIILILLIFLIFIYSVFKKIYLENEERIKLILVGCISLILVQAMIHIGVNIRLFPTTGMTLPFISYGGSSIISISILSGIILNLTKRKIG